MNCARDKHEELSVEWREFQSAWQDSRALWKDDVALQFQKRFMSPFESEMPAFFKRLEALTEELRQAQTNLQ